jgi:hypothetical protein
MSSSIRPCPSASLLGGVALGAGLMYLLDLDRGGGRRARLRQLAATLGGKVRDWQKTLQATSFQEGIAGASTPPAVVFPTPVPDWVLAERARLEIWRAVAHPDSIQISARDGHLTLWGPVRPGESEALREKLEKLPGLHGLELQLTTPQEVATRVA